MFNFNNADEMDMSSNWSSDVFSGIDDLVTDIDWVANGHDQQTTLKRHRSTGESRSSKTKTKLPLLNDKSAVVFIFFASIYRSKFPEINLTGAHIVCLSIEIWLRWHFSYDLISFVWCIWKRAKTTEAPHKSNVFIDAIIFTGTFLYENVLCV